jgi:hypothetical protein
MKTDQLGIEAIYQSSKIFKELIPTWFLSVFSSKIAPNVALVGCLWIKTRPQVYNLKYRKNRVSGHLRGSRGSLHPIFAGREGQSSRASNLSSGNPRGTRKICDTMFAGREEPIWPELFLDSFDSSRLDSGFLPVLKSPWKLHLFGNKTWNTRN